MNTLMYDALKNTGVKEEEARAATIEAGQNDLHYLALEHAIDKLRSHVDESNAKLRADILEINNRKLENDNQNANRKLENDNRNSHSDLTIILTANAVGIGFLSMLMVILT